MKKCNCQMCIENRIVGAAINIGNVEILARVINRLQGRICNMGQDLDVMKAIMDGTWPSAQKQLYRALGKTISKQYRLKRSTTILKE